MRSPTVAITSPGRLARAGAAAWALLGIVALVLLTGWARREADAGRAAVRGRGAAGDAAAAGRGLARGAAARGPRWPRSLSILLAIAVFGALIALILPPFIARLTDLGSSLQEGVQKVAYSAGESLAGMDRAEVDRQLETAADRLRERAGGMAGDAVAGVSSLAGALASVVLVVFLCFFLVKDGRRLWTWLVELAPERAPRRDRRGRPPRLDVADRLHARRGVRRHRRRGADRRRAAAGRRPARAAADRAHLAGGVLPDHRRDRRRRGRGARRARHRRADRRADRRLVAIVVVQQVEGNVLYPVVIGPRLRLHPIVVLVAVAAGGTIAGIAGAFLAVPVATVCGALLAFQRERRGKREDAAAVPPRRGVLVHNGTS